MVIRLMRKADATDSNPLVVLVEYKGQNFIKKVGVGETLEVDDQLAYTIMSAYPNCFEQFAAGGGYKTKVMNAEGTK
jgi:hypothetical protein